MGIILRENVQKIRRRVVGIPIRIFWLVKNSQLVNCGIKSNFSPLVLYGLTESFVVKISLILMVIDSCNTNRLASKY